VISGLAEDVNRIGPDPKEVAIQVVWNRTQYGHIVCVAFFDDRAEITVEKKV
jgi:hypothetical protein